MPRDIDEFEEETEGYDETDEQSDKQGKSKRGSKSSKTDSKSNTKKKPRKRSAVERWFREMRSEVKKVIWLSPKQTMNNTLVALSVMVAAGIAIWGVDQVASTIFNGIRTALRLGG